MAKRELIDTKKLIRKMNQSTAFDISDRIRFSNLIDGQRPVTEQEIVKPYLDKIRERVEKLQKACDKNDLNLLAQHSAFGMVLDIFDEYKAESEE